ncbi:MAG: hypothetical protein AB1589_13100 [Cyanobacteriota bacterium]
MNRERYQILRLGFFSLPLHNGWYRRLCGHELKLDDIALIHLIKGQG